MSDLKTRCAACGLPGHRYGRNEGMDRYDPMACINQLRGVLEDLLANGQREPDYEAAARAGYEATNVYQSGSIPEWEGASPYNQAQWRAWSLAAVDAAIGDKLLIDPTGEEERDAQATYR